MKHSGVCKEKEKEKKKKKRKTGKALNNAPGLET